MSKMTFLIKQMTVAAVAVSIVVTTAGMGRAASVSVTPTSVVLGDPVNALVATWSGFTGTSVNVGVYYGNTPTLLCHASTTAPTTGNQHLLTTGACGTGWSPRTDYRVGIQLKTFPFQVTYSNYFSVVKLSTPVIVSAEFQSDNNWNYVRWNSVTGATGYNVYWGTSSGVTTDSNVMSTNTTEYGHSGVEPGSSYYYRVAAFNSSGESALSPVQGVTVPPAPPTGVSVSFQSDQNWNYITWDAVSGATGYKVYWGTTSGVTTGSNVMSTDTTDYGHSGVEPGSTYYYRVASLIGSTESVLSEEVSVTVPLLDDTAPIVTEFIIPDTIKDTRTVIITSLSASDNSGGSGIAGYLVSESAAVPEVTDTRWSDTAPETFTLPSDGAHTLYAFVKDGTGNVSEPMSAQVTNTYTVAVEFAGTGGGSVHSTPAGLTCASGSTETCSREFTGGTEIDLLVTPDIDSLFDGWSGACSGSGVCTVTMDATNTVTATLTLAPAVKIGDTPYPSLAAAYNAASSGAVIEMLEGNSDTMIANRSISVRVKGGFNAAYSDIVGETSLTGTFLLRAGTVRVQRLKVGAVQLPAPGIAP